MIIMVLTIFYDYGGFDEQKSQLSESRIVLTGGQLHPNLVTEYSGIDNGWQVRQSEMINSDTDDKLCSK